jgi:membrane associated rhomboid family serine protease
MKSGRSVAVTLMPWAGLVVGLLATAFVHQFGSETMFDHCRTASPGPVLVAAFVGLLACLLSGLASWRGMRGSADDARRVIATISIGMAALFGFAILLPMIAALTLPPCFQ